jgi:hypothetical protein
VEGPAVCVDGETEPEASRPEFLGFAPNDKKKARRVLWYPTQAKTRLEWGTQPWGGDKPIAMRSSIKSLVQ